MYENTAACLSGSLDNGMRVIYSDDRTGTCESPAIGVRDMREYLRSFFSEFAYEETDARYLLDVYDRICRKEAAQKLLQSCVAAYRKPGETDYRTEILDRANEISAIMEIHPYTVHLLVLICMTKRLRELYRENGIDMQIYRDTVLDLKWKLEECKTVKGICGTFVAPWYPRFFELGIFALGRLQFELRLARCDYEKNGIKLEKEKSVVINVHIPRTGAPMDKDSCDRAYAAARVFFGERGLKDCPFVCHSWLLYPENKKIVPHHTNTYRFMSEYDIIDWGVNGGEDLWRLFDTEETDPDKLPTNGSLRRAYVQHLKNGGAVGWGYGVRP